MCLAFPAKVIEIRGEKAIVEMPGLKREVLNKMIHAKEGEFVLVQQGFIIDKVSEEDAKEVWDCLEE